MPDNLATGKSGRGYCHNFATEYFHWVIITVHAHSLQFLIETRQCLKCRQVCRSHMKDYLTCFEIQVGTEKKEIYKKRSYWQKINHYKRQIFRYYYNVYLGLKLACLIYNLEVIHCKNNTFRKIHWRRISSGKFFEALFFQSMYILEVISMDCLADWHIFGPQYHSFTFYQEFSIFL